MNYLIVESHPYEESFNAAAAAKLQEVGTQKGHSVKRINLVDDGFNPTMTANDLRLWAKGESDDPLVQKYQKAIDEADILIFPFPIWWGTMPAILKGFCDKIFLQGWAYKDDENGKMMSLLKGKKAMVIITMETPLDVFENQFNDPVKGGFINDTLEICGIEVVKYYQIEDIISGGRAGAERRMAEIATFIE